MPTDAALRFVGTATWEALSGHPVATDVWSDVPSVQHVHLGRWAELVIVAPATADLLARSAAGLADDLLTTSLLTATCPVLLCPAMHTEMWNHPATQANVATLRARGIHVLDPAVGRLTGEDSGAGRLPEPPEIAAAAMALVAPQDLQGRHVVVTAGGTREPLDPVRYLGNHSSGRQGVAIADRARRRGARVTLVAAHLAVPAPAGVEVVEVATAEQMRAATVAAAERADAVVMAAAVADFRPAQVASHKIKKRYADPAGSGDTGAPEAMSASVELVANPDILRELVERRAAGGSPAGQIIVGFAAETGSEDEDVLALGRAKLARKGCDLLVVNDVSHGRIFGESTTEAVIVEPEGAQTPVPHGTKEALADTLWDRVVGRFPATR